MITNPNDLKNKQTGKIDLSHKYITKTDLRYATPEIDNERVQEIKLPSGGKVYPESSYLSDGIVKLRYMKGRDEDLFSNPNYTKEGTAIDMLLKHLCVDKEFEPNDLILADRLFLIVSARIMNLGGEVVVKDIICPSCEYKKEQHTFKLENIKETATLQLPDQNHINKYELQLPVSGDKVNVSITNGHLMRAFKDMLEKSTVKTDRLYTISTALALSDAPVEDSNDLGQLLAYVDNLPIRDVKEIRKKLNAISGVTTASIDYECPNCGHREDYVVPLDETFFFPEL